jgi:mRNA interferase HigB
MMVISIKRLRDFWQDPKYPHAEEPLRAWHQITAKANWTCFADVRATFGGADPVGNKVVFDIGGNKYRIIAVIDYEHHRVFIRAVMDHKEYDRGNWKKDDFGEDWEPQATLPKEPEKVPARLRRPQRGGGNR